MQEVYPKSIFVNMRKKKGKKTCKDLLLRVTNLFRLPIKIDVVGTI